jgi:hypothetical protein
MNQAEGIKMFPKASSGSPAGSPTSFPVGFPAGFSTGSLLESLPLSLEHPFFLSPLQRMCEDGLCAPFSSCVASIFERKVYIMQETTKACKELGAAMNNG